MPVTVAYANKLCMADLSLAYWPWIFNTIARKQYYTFHPNLNKIIENIKIIATCI